LSDTYVASFNITVRNPLTGLFQNYPVSVTITYTNDGTCSWVGSSAPIFPNTPAFDVSVFLTNQGDPTSPCVFEMDVEANNDFDDGCNVQTLPSNPLCAVFCTTPVNNYNQNTACTPGSSISGAMVS